MRFRLLFTKVKSWNQELLYENTVNPGGGVGGLVLTMPSRNSAVGMVTKALPSGNGFSRKLWKPTAPGATGGDDGPLVTATLNCRLYILVPGTMLRVTGA